MKGQNLRVMSDYTCFAGSTSATLSINVQTESASTNDTVGDFEEVDVVGKSFTMTTDALVFGGVLRHEEGKATVEKTVAGKNLSVYNSPVRLRRGDSVVVYTEDHQQLVVLDSTQGAILAISRPGEPLTYTSMGDEANYFVAKISSTNKTIGFMVWDGEPWNTEFILNAIKGDEILNVSLNMTDGEKNRDSEEDVFVGYAYITDFQINSVNRQRPTYSVTFSGSTI